MNGSNGSNGFNRLTHGISIRTSWVFYGFQTFGLFRSHTIQSISIYKSKNAKELLTNVGLVLPPNGPAVVVFANISRCTERPTSNLVGTSPHRDCEKDNCVHA